eukprot:TRINITY_DN68021_c0_g1_i1.p1 TRINITY_DN68021_c0_g1~~TRINITY_DN68021_c0_g1_i1.p1  ORF type:complete len:946 (+),score=162.80 TRINITY_DN68021_c0_g1_i1:62-2899(+)
MADHEEDGTRENATGGNTGAAVDADANMAEKGECVDSDVGADADVKMAEDDGKAAEVADEEGAQEPGCAKELEVDSVDDPRPKLAAGTVLVPSGDGCTSFNAVPSHGGRVLLSLADGGLHHLLAAARANVGVKQGRYMFEVHPLEGARCKPEAHPPKGHGKDGRAPPPPVVSSRPYFAVGFSSTKSALFLGDDANSCGFDSNGNFLQDGDQIRVGQRIPMTDHRKAFGLLLNLDPSSANANTLSFFCDGRRLCPPQPLPEALKGRTLFPTVNYKHVTLRMNFGPDLIAPLSFRCSTLASAAQDDVEIPVGQNGNQKLPADILFPVGLPDEGTFEWLNTFLDENPSYTELSDRSLLEWARRTGLQRAKGYKARNSNDRPGMELGIAEFDNATVKRTLATMATNLGRSCVVMEVRNNLLAAERRKMLDHYSGPEYRRVAMVVMGEPPAAWKAAVQERTLAEKRRKVANDVRTKRREEEKNAEGEVSEEPLEDAVKKAVDAVELTEEEKQLWFYKSKDLDLSAREFGRQFSNFSIPEMDEGWDDIKFVWQPKERCAEYLSGWISDKKLTQRIEDLQPGEWFKEKWSAWQDLLDQWRWSDAEWRDKNRKRKSKSGDDGDDADEEHPAEDADSGGTKDVKPENLDVYTVANVFDIAKGEPLFANFEYEDWTLLGLRAELLFLVHGFRYDLNDPERPAFHLSHLSFYYQKYFKKPLEPKHFGVASLSDLLNLVKDTVEPDPISAMMEAMLSDDSPLDNLLKLTEDARRERSIAADAGDDSAVLKFSRPAQASYDRSSGGSNAAHGRYPQSSSGHGGGRDRHGGGSYGSKGGRDAGGYSGRLPPPPPSGMGGGDRWYGGDPRGAGSYGGSYGGYPTGYSSLPPPPPRGGYGHAPAPSSSSYGGSNKRSSYEASHQDGYRGNGAPPYKQARGSSYGAPPPSRGGYSGSSYSRR